MKIEVLCSDRSHPVFPWLLRWKARVEQAHEVEIKTRAADLGDGDLLFLICCSEIVKRPVRERFSHSLVIHASSLPEGKGWSPLVWQILEGREHIQVSLFEAADAVDSGAIWKKSDLHYEGHELFEEINQKLFRNYIDLMDFAVANLSTIVPVPQDSSGSTYYRRRTPEDSVIDPERPIVEQFDLLRVCDPERYPAFFELRGHRYEIVLRKASTDIHES